MLRVLSLAPLLVAAEGSAKAPPVSKALGDVISILEQFRENIQTAHTEDAKLYEDVACKCHDKVDGLTAETGSMATTAAAIDTATATIDEMVSEIATQTDNIERETKVKDETTKLEQEQAKAWTEEEAILTKAAGENESAVLALEGAQTALGSEHPVITKMVEDMLEESSDTLAELRQKLGKGNYTRKKNNAENVDTIVKAKEAIKVAEQAKADAEASYATAKNDLVLKQEEMKDLSGQLKRLNKFCEAQAHDWDKMSATRDADFDAVGQAIVALGGTPVLLQTGTAFAGANPFEAFKHTNARVAFLQKAADKASASLVKESSELNQLNKKLWQSPAAQRNALRSLVQVGEETGNKALMLFQEHVDASMKATTGQDPLAGAKVLLRKLIGDIQKEQYLDNLEQGECAATLTEATTKRDNALSIASVLKAETEEMGETVTGYQTEWDEQKVIFTGEKATADDLQDVTIPEEISTYTATKTELETALGQLQQAVQILKAHFSGSKRSTGDELTHPDGETGAEFGRKTGNDRGSGTQSTGVIQLIETEVAKIKKSLADRRAKNISNLEDFNAQARDSRGAQAAAAERMKWLKMNISKLNKEFAVKIEEMKVELEVATKNGRVVQELEPCGIQTDRRAKREQEIVALKKAWAILHPDNPNAPEFPVA
jgi:hypothetical protein